MKKLLLITPLLFMWGVSKSQNLVGESFYDAKKELNEKGLVVNEDYSDGFRLLTASSEDVFRVYLFNSNNVCSYARVYIKGITYTDCIEILKKTDYNIGADGKFYSNDGRYISELEYDNKTNRWAFSFYSQK